MKSLSLWLFLIFLYLSTNKNVISATHYNEIPRLSPMLQKGILAKDNPIKESSINIPQGFQKYYYEQTLDHFNYNPESYTTFRQKYYINTKFWGGAKSNSPIFVYLGAELELDSQLLSVTFPIENAPRFNAMLVYIEHRYYGESIPSGSYGMNFGYFSSAQAIADFAEVLIHVKENFSARYSPIIVFGVSYGGMLAAWFRLKYPHVALGALASSAPILYFNNVTAQDAYYSIVTKDFKEASESCYQTIRTSWAEIDKVALEPNGHAILGQKFNSCSGFIYPDVLKSTLKLAYAYTAQYNAPPGYPVTRMCEAIDGKPKGTDILDRIAAGLKFYYAYFYGLKGCLNVKGLTDSERLSSVARGAGGWNWQTCSEMVFPFGITEENSMFPKAPFNLTAREEYCENLYHVPPRPDWASTYYGGKDIKLVLRRFASNIIFSNGLSDPYSGGGVVEDLSDSLLAVTTTKGSHGLDLYPANKKSDPEWLVTQRNTELRIINGWIKTYYADLIEITK